MSTTFPLEMAYVFCQECGLPYAVPLEYVRMKEEGIFCPNGHENTYHLKDDEAPQDSEKVMELRRELIQATHRMEQAEARATENQKPATARRRRSGE
jgi:uncharacterized Zn finger protein (UPF0148 family)